MVGAIISIWSPFIKEKLLDADR
ncbi:MAG: hypothetical protein RIS88_2927, partial [Pseudomonadota bacterium]